MRTIDAVLAECPAFRGLAPDQLAFIAGCAWLTGFEEGVEIFREGDPADTFYLVRKGSIALDLHVPGRGGLTIETLHPCEVVGWSWLIPPYRWEFDGRAAEPTRAIAFDGACIRRKCEEDTALGYELMRRFAEIAVARLHSTRVRLLDVYGSAPVA